MALWYFYAMKVPEITDCFPAVLKTYHFTFSNHFFYVRFSLCSLSHKLRFLFCLDNLRMSKFCEEFVSQAAHDKSSFFFFFMSVTDD